MVGVLPTLPSDAITWRFSCVAFMPRRSALRDGLETLALGEMIAMVKQKEEDGKEDGGLWLKAMFRPIWSWDHGNLMDRLLRVGLDSGL